VNPSPLSISESQGTLKVVLRGVWQIERVPQLQEDMQKVEASQKTIIEVDGKELETLDTGGAYILLKYMGGWREKGRPCHRLTLPLSPENLQSLSTTLKNLSLLSISAQSSLEELKITLEEAQETLETVKRTLQSLKANPSRHSGRPPENRGQENDMKRRAAMTPAPYAPDHFLLKGRILRFFHRFHGEESCGEVVIRYSLTHRDKVLAQKTFQARATAPQNTPKGGAEALNQALERVIIELMAWLGKETKSIEAE